MAKEVQFDSEDEEFFGSVGSFGVPKFDNEMRGGVPRGFTMIAFTDTCLLYTSPSPRDS